MQLKYNYWFFKQALDKETCEQIIALGDRAIAKKQELGEDTSAWTWGSDEKHSKPNATPTKDQTRTALKQQGINDSYVRDSHVSWLDDPWIYDILHPLIDKANYNAGWQWQWDWSESLQYTTYYEGGFYGWHRDGTSDHLGKFKKYFHGITEEPMQENGKLPATYTEDPNMMGKIRKISMTVNLTDPSEYEGGDLKFDFGEHTNEGEQFVEAIEARDQGSVIIFPSFIPHCITPVTSGTRKSLVMWTLGEPFK